MSKFYINSLLLLLKVLCSILPNIFKNIQPSARIVSQLPHKISFVIQNHNLLSIVLQSHTQQITNTYAPKHTYDFEVLIHLHNRMHCAWMPLDHCSNHKYSSSVLLKICRAQNVSQIEN